MRYQTLKSDVEDCLEENGYTLAAGKPVLIHPGPNDPNHPARFITLTRIGGPGLQVDGLIDGVGYQVKAAGNQGDYSDSEALAFALDEWFLNRASQDVHGEWVVGIARVGSPPVPLLVDNADRTHFVCNYVMTVRSVVR